jgi:hypothetical protein
MAFCLLTYTSNEHFFFPIWHKYYTQLFDSQDIYIINNNPKDNLVEDLALGCNIERFFTGFNQDFYEIFSFVGSKLIPLLEKYKGIYIAESDEILHHPLGLATAAEVYLDKGFDTVRALGYEPIHDFFGGEPQINENLPLLTQRKKWREAPHMRKIVFMAKPIDFYWNMHNFDDKYSFADYQLKNIHLKLIDYAQLHQRNSNAIKEKNFNPEMVEKKFNWQNRIENSGDFDGMFKHAASMSFEIPDRLKNIV